MTIKDKSELFSSIILFIVRMLRVIYEDWKALWIEKIVIIIITITKKLIINNNNNTIYERFYCAKSIKIDKFNLNDFL